MSYIWFPLRLFAQLIVLLYPGVLVFWLVMHSHIEHWRKVGKKAYWIASIGWPATAMPLLYFRKSLFPASRPVPPVPVLLAGILALLLAFILARRAGDTISLRTLVGLPELDPGKNRQPLMTAGIYSKTRNPVYLAHWLLIFSSAAITGFQANWALFALDCIVLPLMIRAEERELLARYGTEFVAYMRRAPRFFPKFT